ncbi:uncharacterized protein LOC128214975 isoform X2 [Mya arenaria]|nr:uncharacterized protein LOC128214975 isoform X2 [Mya arenaria]
MWRMHLNEELAGAAMSMPGHKRSEMVTNITSSYYNRRESWVYGRQMKSLSSTGTCPTLPSVLSDNIYLVYGLPRVSIKQNTPKYVTEMHQSLHELDLVTKRSCTSFDAAKELNIQQEYMCVNGDVRKHIVSSESSIPEGIHNYSQNENDSQVRFKEQPSNEVADVVATSSTKPIHMNSNDKCETAIPKVSKSLEFWEKLAKRKNEIIELEKVHIVTKSDNSNERGAISCELLQNQQKLLKKTLPSKRSSKDLWRSVAQRKTEIVLLKENDRLAPNEQKQKTGQFWSFIFSKKKDILQMKRSGNKTESNDKKEVQEKKSSKDNVPKTFEDSFQKELADKLRKRRVAAENTGET